MSKYPIYIEDVSVEAVFNKLGGVEGARRFLRGELSVSEPTRSWREEDGVIYFSVTSSGMSGEGWIAYRENKGTLVGDHVRSVLRSKDFVPSKAGIVTEVVVLKGMLFEDNGRTTSKIHAEAKKRNLATPNPEVACLIREQFTDKEILAMGLWWIVAMHEPIKDHNGDPRILGANRHNDGLWLRAHGAGSDGGWGRGVGFAFAVPQV